MLSGCGSTNIQLDPPSDTNSGDSGDSGNSNDCTDVGSTVTTDAITVTVSGVPCNDPSPSGLETGEIILDCAEPAPGRNTDDSSADFVTASCGDGDGAAANDYFCVDGVVFRSDGGSGVELFDTIIIECVIDSAGNASFLEEELIVS